MGKRDYDPNEIDSGILPLVDILNEIDSIETYSSCHSHDDERQIMRTPYVSFWLKFAKEDEGGFQFSQRALMQLGTLSWIVSQTFEDGFQFVADMDHRLREPVASIVVFGEGPGLSHDEVPDLWTPMSYSLRLRHRSRPHRLASSSCE